MEAMAKLLFIVNLVAGGVTRGDDARAAAILSGSIGASEAEEVGVPCMAVNTVPIHVDVDATLGLSRVR